MNRIGWGSMAVVLAAAMLVSGCNNTQKGAAGGAVVGAGLGAIIGHQSGRAGEGAALGALVGALAGGLIGNAIDEKERRNERMYSYNETVQQRPQSYDPSEGIVLETLNMEITPSRVRPGGEVEVRVRYRVLLPRNVSSIRVSEETEVFLPAAAEEPPRRFERNEYVVESGTYNLTRVITLPANSVEGVYEVRTKLRADRGVVDSSAGTFRVVF